jgi:hypothetical protein
LHLHGQFNDTVSYNVGISSSGTYNKTNTNIAYLLNNSVKAGLRREDVSLNTSLKYLYGVQQQKKVNDDLNMVIEINLYKTFPHFNYWVLFNYNKIYSLRINHQLQAGGGIAYNIIDRKNFTFNISDGLLYDYNDVLLNDVGREVYDTPRNSFRLQVKSSFRDLLVFQVSGYLQNSLQRSDDYIIRNDASLSLKLVKWLNLIAKSSYNQYSRNNRENLFMTYGLSFDKYF